MRVLFDARPGQACATGIGRYARSFAQLVPGVPGHDAHVLGGSGDLRLSCTSHWEEELLLPMLLEDEGVEVYHSPLFHLPAVLPCRSIVTMHDAIPLVRPTLTNPQFAVLFEDEAPAAARRADRIVCPSDSAKRDLVEHLGVKPDRVRVVPEAPDPIFRELDQAPEPEREFILVVGSLEERKNPKVVLDAVARLPDEQRPLVVFAGPSAGFDVTHEAAARDVKVDVRGLVSDEELVRLYNDARALVFPSLYEGFGLPIVEAFACGTPVLAANASALPEVAGDAARLFDPNDPVALKEAIRDVLWFSELRDELRAKGRARLAEQFSPARIQRALSALYEELAA